MMKRMKTFFYLLYLLQGFAKADALDASTLHIKNLTGELKKRAEFWVQIYSFYGTHEGVIHDAQYPYIIFQKVDYNPKKIETSKKYYRTLLANIHSKLAKGLSLNAEENSIAAKYKDVHAPLKFYHAANAKRIRFQLGQKDRFLQGLYYSGRYLHMMETIFKDRGLPVELSRLPFVESSFNLSARSKVGASGIWQFMPYTGKLFMQINATVDERNDPLRASEAAATLLQQNYESLRHWPLAVTAYNHGREGMMRAVRTVKSTMLEDIIENYKSKSFGFASSNFFAELVAAIEVEKNADRYFSKVERDVPPEFIETILTDYVRIQDLCTYLEIPFETLKELNPGFTHEVLTGQLYVPAGYSLRIPRKHSSMFLAKYQDIPVHKKYLAQASLPKNTFRSIASLKKKGTTLKKQRKK